MANAFVAKYGTMHRWRTMQDRSEVLIVGADNPTQKECGWAVVLRYGGR